MEKIEMIWAMFKVYLNNPNYLVKREDVLYKLFGEGKRDLDKFMHSLGFQIYPENITYGQLLTKIGINV